MFQSATWGVYNFVQYMLVFFGGKECNLYISHHKTGRSLLVLRVSYPLWPHVLTLQLLNNYKYIYW